MPQLQINQGPQDALLYDNTRSYFTNVGYVRTSNFQMELRDVPSQNTAALGSTVHYVIPKSADLLGPVDLLVEFQQASDQKTDTNTTAGNWSAWVESLGYAMIDTMTFSVGSHDVETITGDQMNIINELMKGDQQRYGKLIGKTGRPAITAKPDTSPAVTGVAASGTVEAGNLVEKVDAHPSTGWLLADNATDRLISKDGTAQPGVKLTVPLSFFFTKHPSQYFPLCSIAGCNDVRITIKFRSLNELVVLGNVNYTGGVGQNAGKQVVQKTSTMATANGTEDPAVPKYGANGAISDCKLRCHYVHVTGPEATTLMNKEHVRLLKLWSHQPKTVSLIGGTAATANAAAVPKKHVVDMDLSFLHPVQELIITIRKVKEMGSAVTTEHNLDDMNGGARRKNYFAYQGGGTDPNIESELNKLHGTSDVDAISDTAISNTLKVKSFELSLNGQERHPSLAGKGIERDYLMDRLMPMLHSNTSTMFNDAHATDGGYDASPTFAHLGEMLDRKEIYVYPFALNPEGANPSGAVNFSKVSHAKLKITIDAINHTSSNAGEEYVVDVYGVYFNWLQIKDGRALTSFA